MDEAAATATASRRSLDADLATDGATDTESPAAHLHACELHRDAAAWWRRAGDLRLVERHEGWAKVHAQLAARLTEDEES